jgi:hypothetical protein
VPPSIIIGWQQKHGQSWLITTICPVFHPLHWKKLVEATCHTKWLNKLIESTLAIKDDISLYRNKHKPNGGSQIYGFYSAPTGEKPISENATSSWYLKISTELLNNVKITKSFSLNLNFPVEPVETTERLGKETVLRLRVTLFPALKKYPIWRKTLQVYCQHHWLEKTILLMAGRILWVS